MVATNRSRAAALQAITALTVLISLVSWGQPAASPAAVTSTSATSTAVAGQRTPSRVFGWPTSTARAAAGKTFPVVLKIDGPAGRTVQLKRLKGRSWKTFRAFRTSGAGSVSMHIPVGRSRVSWKVVVPAARGFGSAATPARTFSSKSGNRASAQPKAQSLGTWLLRNRRPTAGAQLPLAYSLSSLSGRIYSVAPRGSNHAAGTIAAPLRTVEAAIAKVGPGTRATIVVRGGTYTQGPIVIPAHRQIRIVAYPGEVPTFDGSTLLTDGWVRSGGLASHPYEPQPVANGSGISFTTGQNLTEAGIGKHPDQAWSGQVELRQVPSKASVAPGTFWVDQTHHRIYVAAGERAWGPIAVSHRSVFAKIEGDGSSLEGLRIRRYSNAATTGGALGILADRVSLRQLEVTGAAFQAIQVGGASAVSNTVLDRVTIADSNWMGVSASKSTNLVLNRVLVGGLNQFDEFSASPQSGALKTSRSRHVRVTNSVIADNHSHGLWFDQSTVDVDLVRNRLTGNHASAVFFEISDDLLMVDNYIRGGSRRAVLLSGASGLKLVNNTIVGGATPLVISTDSRSKPGCADPVKPLCSGSLGSDRDTLRPRPATLDWMPRIDLMLNNVIANPGGSDLCGAGVPMCITLANKAARTSLNAVIHAADPSRGIPRSVLNGNVYASSSKVAVRTSRASYSTAAVFGRALRAAPVWIAGAESRARSGARWVTVDGRPTAVLKAAHRQAARVPKNAELNRYISAGTTRYGATW